MAPQPGARRVGREKGPVVVSCGGLRAGPRQGSAGRPQFSLSASEPRQRGKRGTERPSNPEALHKVSLAPKFERRRGGTPTAQVCTVHPLAQQPGLTPAPRGSPLSGSGGMGSPAGPASSLGPLTSLARQQVKLPEPRSMLHFPTDPSTGGQPRLPWGTPRSRPWALPSRSWLTPQQSA